MLASEQWEVTGVWGKSAQHANELVTLIVRSSRLLFLDLEIPLFYQQLNAHAPNENSLVIFKVGVYFDSSGHKQPNDYIPFKIFLSPLSLLCRL